MNPRQHRKDNTKTMIGLGFLAVFSLMILVSWLSMSSLQAVNVGMSALIEDTERKTSRAYQMRDDIRLRSNAVRSLLQIDDLSDRERIFEKLVVYTSDYNKSRTELVSFGANPREQEILDKIEVVDQRVAEAYEKTSNVIYAMQPTSNILRTVLGDLQLQELVLLNHLNELVGLEKNLAQEELQTNQATYKRTRQVLLLIVIGSFAFSLLISAAVINRVTQANRHIAHLASHDDLTGLHNRRSFEEQLRHTIGLAQRGDNTYGLLYLDLDRFKIVNDTCGHHAGDQLLIQLTTMIQARLRRGDLFARVGGDEFSIIASGNSFVDIRQLAEDLRVIVADYAFIYAEQTFKVSLSIGAIPIDGRVVDIEQLLSDVDSACYVAKQSGRNRVHVTQENDAEVVKYRSDIAGIQSIRQALSQDRLSLFFQPVFGIDEEQVNMAHCEILLRIRSESGELFSPAKFIPIAEKYNVMSEIDRWVFTHVVEWLVEHQNDYVVPRLMVNLSGLSFVDEDFNEFIINRLLQGDVDPSLIAFEITETAAVDNFEKARLFIARIRALGCHFALDDFGSGFSTFAYLKHLPIDYLKIDGSLVRNMANDSVDREMVRSINQIGHTVGARTVAEFVEDDTTLSILRDMNVDFAQGYGLRMPTPLDQLVEELAPRGTDLDLRKAS
ncbi:MAG: EAL domain-containing protein [Granulosicoccus sp.]